MSIPNLKCRMLDGTCPYGASSHSVVCTSRRTSHAKPSSGAGARPIGIAGPAADAELGDEAVAVAAVDRARELDDLAARGARDALEQERRRVERDAERRRLLLVRHRRLDRLRAADDLDPVAVARAGRRTSSPRDRARSARGRAPRGTCSSSTAIGSPSARRRRLTDEHGLGRRDVQDAAEPRARRDRPELERAAARREAALAHVVAERGDRHPLRDLRLGDERARAAAARQVALAHELVERRAHGQPRDAEVDARAAARTGSRRRPRAPRSARAPARGSRAASSSASPLELGQARPARRRQPGARPVCGSKNWKPLGSTASSSRSPTRAPRARVDPRGEQRAAAVDQRRARRRPASSTSAVIERAVDGEEDVRVGAEVLEHLDDDLDRRQPRRERARPRSSRAGCRGSPARRRAGGRARAGR